jgi:surface polysaccharide O-acyltransferase-like enzyme
MRKRYIDWLRIFGIFLLFPYHAARVFDPYEINYIQSAVKSSVGATFMFVVWPWFMPLMFLIAGMCTWYALLKKDAGQFLKERVSRLLVPLILGTILIVPIQGYAARLQQGTLNGGYFNYLFTQFFPDFSDISGYRGTFTPAHLWFILYLFVISCLLLPVFIHTIRARQKKGAGRFGRLFEKDWFLFLLAIPLSACEALPDVGGKNPFFYGLYFAIGFFIASNENAWKAVDRVKWHSLGIMLLSFPVFYFLNGLAQGTRDFSWQSVLTAPVRNLYGVSALLFMMAFARKYLDRGGKALDYLSGAAFPVYILHQSVMMVTAHFVLQWNIGITAQFIAISLLTLVISIALYEGSRHVLPLRILLGIKKSKKTDLPARVPENGGSAR